MGDVPADITRPRPVAVIFHAGPAGALYRIGVLGAMPVVDLGHPVRLFPHHPTNVEQG